ncbi:DNA alkylation repair protein [Paenisporosarcina antarctica]|uniref:DNA alkylation repair protein n=1 Tax=Paenisporosarcina antarctica TaxID=417367 RepID=A0A4V1AML8_9BACL|nr:DNA alkylation repair protein [Paenisporosarcina antarctica]QBP39725.1 DNA alkylation repair protein [Paenisporosarcina antarctica]
MNTTLEKVMSQLEELGSENSRASYEKLGAGTKQFGVGAVKTRAIAKKIKKDHPLALELWQTGNSDAQFLAALIMNPSELSKHQIEQLVDEISYSKLLDEVVGKVVMNTPYAKDFANEWMNASEVFKARAGWHIHMMYAVRVNLSNEEINSLLHTIESEMKDAPPYKQETMNKCLVEIALHHDSYTARCLEIGERLGQLSDKKVHKGCTSPYAPEWIAAVLAKRL